MGEEKECPSETDHPGENAEMRQNVGDGGTGYQTQVTGGTAFIGGTHQHLPNDPNSPDADRVPSNLPLSHARAFVGRDDDLERLHKQLQAADRAVITTVTGMGGVGKTELALQYARARAQSYPAGIAWFQVRAADLGAQILSFGKVQLGLEPPDQLETLAEQVQWIWARWRPPTEAVLLVLDDVTDYAEIRDYLPREPRFRTLCTTRLQALSLGFERLLLVVLSEAAALDLLRSLAGLERIEAEPEAAKALCQELGCLPLGLELVGQYLAEAGDLSLAEMLEELRDEKLSHPGMEEPTAATTANQGVRAAFELSWRKLSAEAQALSCLLSIFALAPIPWELVERATAVEAKVLRRVRDRELVKRSLLERNQQGVYQLHQLVREFLCEKLATHPEAESLKRGVGTAMVQAARQMPQTPTLEQVATFTPLIPHWQETTRSLTDFLDDDGLTWPFIALGHFYQGQGRYAAAEPWYEGGLTAARQRFGEDHPSVAATLNNLAGLYYAQGKYEQAEPLYLAALPILFSRLGQDHPNSQTVFSNFVGCLRQAQQAGRADTLSNHPLTQDLLRQIRALG